MVPAIFLSLEMENAIMRCHRMLFGFSLFFNAIASVCLFKQAPEMQSEIKFYLYYMQVLIFLSDFILDLAIEPFNLLPLFGGYCKGFACEWMSIKQSLMMTFLILSNIAFCICSCIFCRHQALVTGRFKFGKITQSALRVAFFSVLCAPVAYGFATHFDDSETEKLIDLNGVSWIRDRGPYVVYKRTHNIAFTLPLCLFLVMMLANIIGIVLFAHTTWHIFRGTMRSALSAKRVSRALLMLAIQLGLPIALICLPATVFFVCIMDNEASLPFGVCYSCVFMINTHSIFHSAVLLAITPAYRRFIAEFCHRVIGSNAMKRKITQQRSSNIKISAIHLGRRFTFPR